MVLIERRRYKESSRAIGEVRSNNCSQGNSGITVIYKLLRLCSIVPLFGSCLWAVFSGDNREGCNQMVSACLQFFPISCDCKRLLSDRLYDGCVSTVTTYRCKFVFVSGDQSVGNKEPACPLPTGRLKAVSYLRSMNFHAGSHCFGGKNLF